MKKEDIQIAPPNFKTIRFNIVGTAPYVQLKMSEKARLGMRDTQEAGSRSKKGTKREPKNFQALFEAATYRAKEGWYGIPETAFRSAMVSACRLVGFQMTRAKMGFFIDGDGQDRDDGTPLVKITEGKPEHFEAMVRNANGGSDIRVRGKWDAGWKAEVKIRYDADMFSSTDITNLLMRVGHQVGIGEGRPDSKRSAGMGWGLFTFTNEKEEL